MAVYFVSQDYIVSKTPLSVNVDADTIKPFIIETQERYVKDVIGENLYNRIIDGATNSNLTVNELALIDKIKPMLANYVVYDALPFISIKLRNKSILKAAGDTLTIISESELLMIRNEIKNKAEYYLTMLQKYLCDNSSLFPEYKSPNNNVVPNSTRSYTIDLYLNDYDVDYNIIKKYFL